MVTAKELRELLNYDPATGVFTWLSSGSGRKLGQPAGTVWKGHRTINIAGERYQAARLAWLYLHGEEAPRRIRFLDGDQMNLRQPNLSLGRTAEEFRLKENRKPEDPKWVKERQRRLNVKRYKGMDMAEYQRMFAAQNGVCAACSREETATRNGQLRWLCVDHCHTTHDVRGLLCSKCNTSIGYADDDAQRLRQLADYLDRHAAKAAEAPPSNVVRLKG